MVLAFPGLEIEIRGAHVRAKSNAKNPVSIFHHDEYGCPFDPLSSEPE